MPELIDVVTDLNEPTGQVVDKKAAHREGLWHRVLSALAVAPARGTILLQVKAADRVPGGPPAVPAVDFTVGGHLLAGEDPADVREVREELGLDLTYAQLHYLGIRQTAATLPGGRVEREFQYWHLIPLERQIEDIPLADPEVAGLVEVTIEDAIQLADGRTDVVPARWSRRGPCGIEAGDARLATANLVTSYVRADSDRIFLRMVIAARRYCAGERDYLFW
ncbi:NUDIX hydrolase [Amycolatopsis saalfeldensis]|uniref:NUDIX domain-containing protein n=1 Tax=Amycolatopsis saalfeldensis TaxID=394193 RepID=A0A1H8Y2T4_9PSEU|nr:NUDIX domain-containing protein [Amycolatopsis saalfeldensis]SEP46594.1 NUDIX domain-containing protein [Amycolatopsis saalfeldensis]